MSTKKKGDIGEAKVLTEILQQGYGVCQPFGDRLPFDLVLVDQENNLLKVQVKYASLKNGVICLKLRSSHQNTKATYNRLYAPDEVDLFGVFCPELDTVYFVPFSEVKGKREFSLRVEASKNGQEAGIHWHERYKHLPGLLRGHEQQG